MTLRRAGSGMVASGVRMELLATVPPRDKGPRLPFRYLRFTYEA